MDFLRRKFSGSGPGQSVAVALAAVALISCYFAVPLDTFGPNRPVISWITLLCALLLLAVLLLRQIRLVMVESDQGRPALVIALLILMSLLIFARSYLALSRSGDEFNGLHTQIDALYFTVITLSTVGYGDVSPAGQEARVVVMVQIAYNFVFLTAGASALTRRLRGQAVTRMQSRQSAASGDPDEGPAAATGG